MSKLIFFSHVPVVTVKQISKPIQLSVETGTLIQKYFTDPDRNVRLKEEHNTVARTVLYIDCIANINLRPLTLNLQQRNGILL